jgi:hypothetical protein
MNIKISPPSAKTSNKCSYLFPYFPSLDRRLAGEQTEVAHIHELRDVLRAALRELSSLYKPSSNVCLSNEVPIIRLQINANNYPPNA